MALNIGGDDYIKKPYTLSVLLAKVQVVLKRLEETRELTTVQESRIRIDHKARKLYIEAREIELKNREFKLFLYLLRRPNTVITKDELFANVWGDG